MKKITSSSLFIAGICLVSTLIKQSQADEAVTDDNWHLTGELYLWAAGINGTTQRGNDLEVSISDVVEHLDMAFMGGLEARKGKWSLIADFIYLDVSKDKTGSLTDQELVTVTADVNVEGWVSNLLAGYRLVDTGAGYADIVFGARYLDVDAKLKVNANVEPPRPGLSFAADENFWDAVAGFRGGIGLPGDFYVPYYVDIGAGQSDLTWQAIVGVGWKPKWGEITLAYRHIEWDFDEGSALTDINFSGPGVSFRYNFF
jgi:hypothetical protein